MYIVSFYYIFFDVDCMSKWKIFLLFLKEIYVYFWKNGLWIRIYICNGLFVSLFSNNVFIIYYFNFEYVFMFIIKVVYK